MEFKQNLNLLPGEPQSGPIFTINQYSVPHFLAVFDSLDSLDLLGRQVVYEGVLYVPGHGKLIAVD